MLSLLSFHFCLLIVQLSGNNTDEMEALTVAWTRIAWTTGFRHLGCLDDGQPKAMVMRNLRQGIDCGRRSHATVHLPGVDEG
ncbi:hypothetical protein N7540_011057 [Penicillium herquei]|nr:hypothetical protein N7540_011057 [Penicillium herquei]